MVGSSWLLIRSGTTNRRVGEEAGQDIAADLIQGDWDDPDYEKTAFKGQAVIIEREASVSIKEIKNHLKSRHWVKAFPVLLIGAGLLGVFIFGSLALMIAMSS